MAQMRAIWHCEIFDTTPANSHNAIVLETGKLVNDHDANDWSGLLLG